MKIGLSRVRNVCTVSRVLMDNEVKYSHNPLHDFKQINNYFELNGVRTTVIFINRKVSVLILKCVLFTYGV